MGKYQKGSFHGVSDIHPSLITGEDKVVILPVLQTYVLH